MISSCITPKDLDVVRVKKDTKIQTHSFEYKLRAGDLLSVQISSLTPFDYDFFNKESGSNNNLYAQNPYLYGYSIGESGTLELPTLGEFDLAGKTLAESEAILKSVAAKYFSDPHVKINVLNFNITVFGEVNNPGSVHVVKSKANILEVIGLAGGFKEFADRKKVKIIRTTDSESMVYFVDLTDPTLTNSNHFYLEPNDVVSVLPMRKRFFVINNLPAAISTVVSAVTLFLLIQPD